MDVSKISMNSVQNRPLTFKGVNEQRTFNNALQIGKLRKALRACRSMNTPSSQPVIALFARVFDELKKLYSKKIFKSTEDYFSFMSGKDEITILKGTNEAGTYLSYRERRVSDNIIHRAKRITYLKGLRNNEDVKRITRTRRKIKNSGGQTFAIEFLNVRKNKFLPFSSKSGSFWHIITESASKEK